MSRENNYNYYNNTPPNCRVNSNLIGPNRNAHHNDPSNTLGRNNDFNMIPNRNFNSRPPNSNYNQNNRGNFNQNSRMNMSNDFQNNIYMPGQHQNPPPTGRITPQNQTIFKVSLKQESPGHPRPSPYPPPQQVTSPQKQIQTPTSRNTMQYPPPSLPNLNRPPPNVTPSSTSMASPEGKTLRFSPPPEASNRSLPKHSVPTKLIMSPYQSPGGSVGNSVSAYSNHVRHYSSPMPSFNSQPPPYMNRGTTVQPPLPNKPPTPPPPPPSEAPPPDVDSQKTKAGIISGMNVKSRPPSVCGGLQKSESPNQESFKPTEGPLSSWRYQANGLPYISNEGAPILMSYPNPTAGATLTHLPPPNYFLNSVPPPQRLMSPRTNLYTTQSPYQNSNYMNSSPIRQNVYKRKQMDMDMDNRKNNKKRKKPLSQNIPQRKDWSVADAKRAIDVEKECNKRAKSQSLIIKFPDLELNRDIVSRFHSAIESVHFQQPSTARFCFVTLRGSADSEKVIQELNRTRFGQGLLMAEVKKDREEDINIGPEDIDPTTLYVGNLAQEVTKEDMLKAYPNTKRIDIGYAKKMKYTRYAFVSFRCVDDAIEAFKRTHSTQMHSKSLIVRFRRLHGTVGMPGETKTNKPDPTNRCSASINSETESPVVGPWDAVDVSGWVPDMTIKSEPNDYTDEDEDYDDYYEDKNNDRTEPHTQQEIVIKREKIESDMYQSNNDGIISLNEDARTHNPSNTAAHFKPSLPVNHQQIEDDITAPPSSRNVQLSNTQENLQMDHPCPNETVEPPHLPTDVGIPPPIIENIKDENTKIFTSRQTSQIDSHSKQPLNNADNINDQVVQVSPHENNENDREILTPKPLMSSPKKEHKHPNTDDNEEGNKGNSELPKPIVEIVKKEVDNQQQNNVAGNKVKPPKDVVLPKPKLIKVENETSKMSNKDLGGSLLPLPKPIMEQKPVIDASTGDVFKTDITQDSNNSSNKHVPEINQELEKEEIKNVKIIDKISKKLNKMQDDEKEVKSASSVIHCPLIMPPEIKKEEVEGPDSKSEKNHDKFKSKDSIDDATAATTSSKKSSKHQLLGVSPPKPILVPPEVKHELPEGKTETNNQKHDIKENSNDLQKLDPKASSDSTTKHTQGSRSIEVNLPQPILLQTEVKKEEDDDNKNNVSAVENDNMFLKHTSNSDRRDHNKLHQSVSQSNKQHVDNKAIGDNVTKNKQQQHRPFLLSPEVKKEDKIEEIGCDADVAARNVIHNITSKILGTGSGGEVTGKKDEKSIKESSSIVNNYISLEENIVKTEIEEENEILGLNDELVFDDGNIPP